MQRLFLSGQTTCALLLGAGLLLRAQAALQKEPEPVAQQAVDAPGEQPSQAFEEHALRARMARPGVTPKGLRLDGAAQAPGEQGRSHSRNGVAHRMGRAKAKRYGAAIAQKLALKRG